MAKAKLTAVITGATSGIGRATAQRFAKSSYDLAICARDADELDKVQENLERDFHVAVAVMSCDLSAPGEASRFANWVSERFEKISVLVNNAADAPRATTAEISSEAFERILSLNIRAPFLITQALLDRLRGGAIINVSSLSAIDPFPGMGIYGASKAWLDLWTKSLAQELAGGRTSVFSIRPGAVATPLLKQVAPDFPIDTALQPDDVARVIFSLASEPWRVASGEAINIQCRITT